VGACERGSGTKVREVGEGRTFLQCAGSSDSFDYDLPFFWGKESASGVGQDDQVVPGLPNYKAWENKKVLSGLRFELKRLIKDSGDTLENPI